MNDADSAIHRISGRSKLDRMAIENDLPRIWLIQARQDFAKCAFARAIFPNERMATSFFKANRNILKRMNAWKRLAQFADFE
jgi:hypothetical protein